MPDTAVDYLILPEEQGNSLLVLLPPERRYPLQSLRRLWSRLYSARGSPCRYTRFFVLSHCQEKSSFAKS